jgi:hypothetical protein
MQPSVQPPTGTSRQNHRRRPSLFWPIVLITSGVLLLLSNLGYLPDPSWNLLWRLWPVLLIALGVDVLIGRRSVAGAIISGVLIFILIGGVVLLVFFARNIPMLAELARAPDMATMEIEHPLDDLETAEIVIDWPHLRGTLSALDDSSNLIEGEIDYYGDLTFNVDESGDHADVILDSHYTTVGFSFNGLPDEGRWDVALHPRVAADLNLDAGSGRLSLDLRALSVTGLMLDAGSGAIELTLPEASTFNGEIDGGSGRLEITVPESVGLRVVLDDGSGSLRTDGRFVLVSGEADDDGIWETENYNTADHTIELEIEQGSGALILESE